MGFGARRRRGRWPSSGSGSTAGGTEVVVAVGLVGVATPGRVTMRLSTGSEPWSTGGRVALPVAMERSAPPDDWAANGPARTIAQTNACSFIAGPRIVHLSGGPAK